MSSRNRDIIQKILAILGSRDDFIIFNHANPDGDAIGSQIALYLVLKKNGKRAYMFSAEEIGSDYHFLPNANEISTILPGGNEIKTAIVLDAAKPDRISREGKIDLKNYNEVINIDHHVSNSKYGTINLVVPESSSTGELLYQIIKQGKFPVDAAIATCLYASIFADTGGFRHSNTTAKVLKYSSELVKAGAQAHLVARHIYACYPERRFHLLSKSLGTLKTAIDGKVAYMWVYANFYNETGSVFADADEFVEFPRALKGVDVAFVIKETKENKAARVNFRSNNPQRNVNRIASKFGGGGHVEAAACNIEGAREEIEQRILDAIRDEFLAMNNA